MPNDHMPSAFPTHHLLHAAGLFLDLADEVIDHLDDLGGQLGYEAPTWLWSTDYDFRDPAARPPVLVGYIANRRPDAARRAARQWADTLGLTPSTKAVTGTVAYDGEINGFKIQISAVVDRTASSDKLSTLTRYAPEILLAGILAATSIIAAVLLTDHNKLATLARGLRR
ncbi:hypothetical protein [Alloactinosynnema sp. L-07]|uniref:hypothetical protein n=1 Tax=Alloactinosynnema sp. L-07 TaxID=1653480 RepID=UPI00065F0B30|nr:hypothetical protein [Alloactinosynnema sp. L-07]CRK56982.1 hypothetical protein [Alloactinosynnema sp. L-07]